MNPECYSHENGKLYLIQLLLLIMKWIPAYAGMTGPIERSFFISCFTFIVFKLTHVIRS